MLATPLSSSTVESSSGPHLFKSYGCNSDIQGSGDPVPARTVPVSQEADKDEYLKDLSKLLQPDSVREIVTFYRMVFLDDTSPPDERQDAAGLIELLLENFDLLSADSRTIVNTYIDWEPCDSRHVFFVTVESTSSSGPHLFKSYGCNSGIQGPGDPAPARTVPVSQEADKDEYLKDLSKLLQPDSVREIVTFYRTVFLDDTSPPDERKDAAGLIELLLENFDLLSADSRTIVNTYIDWEPCDSRHVFFVTVESSSGPHLFKSYACNSDIQGSEDPAPARTVPVSQEADKDEYLKDLSKLLQPDSVREIVTFYRTVFLDDTSPPDKRKDAAGLIELLLENFDLLSADSRTIVNTYIDWEPCDS